MGARWSWSAICEFGHITGNFSGGSDGVCDYWLDDEQPCGLPLVNEIRDEGLTNWERDRLLRGPALCSTCRRPWEED